MQEVPFQGIDLLVASHPHADHFSAGLVFSYLRENPDVSFAATTATMELLQDSTGADYQTIQSQLREINPPWGESETLPPTSVHFLEGYGLEEESIEILFADPWFVMSQEGQHLIQDVLRPGNLILMHIRPDEWEGQKDEGMAIWPDAIVFQESLERRVF